MEYLIVVEQDGYLLYSQPHFVTWNSNKANVGSFKTAEESHTYKFDLKLLAGDVDGDIMVTNDDFNQLAKYYNRTWTEEGLQSEDPAVRAEQEMVRRCDFNHDGVVNALDRGSLYGNIGKSTTHVGYDYTKAPELQNY